MVRHPFPAFLARAFDPDELEGDDSTIVALDAFHRIAWVNSAWWRFAEENGAAEVADRFGVGSLYIDGISGPLKTFYSRVLAHVSASGQPWEQRYECSSPREFRLMHLRVSPVGGGGLLLDHSPRERRPHQHFSSAAPTPEAPFRDQRGVVLQCSNCRRTWRVGDGWHWIEPWVKAPPTATSHGLCGPCSGLYILQQESRKAAREKER